MAIMIPESPREYEPLSLEGEMFESLKSLPDDYYIIHSFKNVHVDDNILHEGETDFIVFNPQYGILCIEAKAGQVKYQGGNWKYASGKDMKHGGPYNQASKNKWDLLSAIQSSSLRDIQHRCKLLHAVWFPSIKEKDLYSNSFPAEFDRNLTMTMEALIEPQKYLDQIFSIELENHIRTDLSENDVKRLIREIICPEFNIFPSSSMEIDLKKITFHRLLKEQQGVLNYLDEQKSAVINGAAGTGKTMIAVEKAMRHASDGEKVLFLCYNSYLRNHLAQEFNHEKIDYMTIDSFACKMCHSDKADYQGTSDTIIDMYLNGTFPYIHVIVDEGQDFGREVMEESDLLQTIHDTVVENDTVKGSFYIFYDKLQMVQAEHIPKYISDADCKLTLYKNCRNTENIALTSLKPITDRVPKLYESAVKGVPAVIHYRKTEEEAVSKIGEIIDRLKNDGITDIVILTCETEKNSILTGTAAEGRYKKKLFTTCRKFKGLEADAVILIDVGRQTFSEENVLRYYVGASRARIRLEIVSTMTDEDCRYILLERIHFNKKIKKPKKELAYALYAMPNAE